MAWTFFRTINGRRRREGVYSEKDDARAALQYAEDNGANCSSVYYCSRDGLRTALGEVGIDDYLLRDPSVGSEWLETMDKDLT